MKRNIHKIYDVLLKIIIMAYLAEFLSYIGEKRKIAEILKTEITTLKGKTRYLDFLCRLEDDTLCNIEFQFPIAYPEDLTRFFDYNIVAQIRFDKITDTIIFNFGMENKVLKGIAIGYSKDFHPKNFYLGDIDFEHELEKINIKLGLGLLEKLINNNKININLTYREELHLLLMSLTPKYNDKKKLLKSIVGLLKNEEIFHEEKIDVIRSVIRLEIENLLTCDEQKEFEGAIKMTNESEKIIKQAVEEVNKKYEQIALEEAKEEGIKIGMEKGMEKGKRETAKNLKGLHTPEEISKITGLSLKTILLL